MPRDTDRTRWIARQVTGSDLPATPPAPAADETVSLAELTGAGGTPSESQRIEAMLSGDRLPASALAPPDLVRVRMTRPGPWTDTLDAVAASVARRLWARTRADVTGAAPEGTDDQDLSRAWSAAVALVLPPEPHPVLADVRYATDGFRDAVRRVAGHLLTAGTGATRAWASAAELADSLRSGLGLPPRWTAPSTAPVAGESAPQPPAAQSRPGGDLPDLDMPDAGPSAPDILDTFDFDALGDLEGFDFGFGAPGDVGDFDFDFGTPGDQDLDLDLDLDQDLGPDPGDLEMTDADPAPVVPAPVAGQPVHAAPVTAPARPLAALPPLSLVPFDPRRTTPADGAERELERLAHRVATAALRNARHRVPLPRIDIAGYGADARGAGTARERDRAAQAQGDLRAQAVRDLFTRKLRHALDALQAHLPPGRTPVRVRDFTISARGRTRVPGQGVTVAPDQRVDHADLGRQATVAVTSPGHAAAVETLDALRRTDRRPGSGTLRSGPLDVDAVARRVLHLAPSVLIDPEMRRDLHTMTERATAAGRATSLAALTAFHLEEQGVLAADRARHVSDHGNRVPGLNWTGPDTVGTGGLFVDLLAEGRTSGPSDLAPWAFGTDSYPVFADGRHDTVEALLPDGSRWDLDEAEFAELVAADLARNPLPADAPIVLAVPSTGDRHLDLPRTLADRTGRTVWVHSGLARRHPDPAALNSVAVLHRDGLPDGTWLPVFPGLAPDPGAPDWHRDVLTQPIVSSLTGRQIGRSLHEPAELVGSRETYADLDAMTVYVHYNAATGAYSAKLPLVDPGPKEKAYFVAGHGLPGRLVLPLADGGSRSAGRHEAGEWLRRRKSLSTLPKDHWVDLVVCYSSAPADETLQDLSQAGDSFPVPFAADPLADDALSLGQHLANVTGRKVRLSYGMQGSGRYQDESLRVLFTDPRGRRWWWETARPEPDEAELDRLAGLAGFEGEPSPATRSELLRLVRALKLVLGPDVQDADDFPALVLGAAAVVNMWFADPDLRPTGPFSPELLRRVVAAHPLAASGVDREVTGRVLADAARTWRGSAPAVGRFVDLPVLRSAAGWLTDTAAVDEAAAAALGLSDPADAAAHRARMFWARVRAEEALAGPDADALTARALRLDPAADLDDALRARARTLLTRGFAADRDMTDPDVTGAYAIEAAGAFDTTGPDAGAGDTDGGRDWRESPAPRPDLGRFRVRDGATDTVATAPWAGRDANGKDRPAPYAVRASVALEDGDHVDVDLGGTSHRVTAAEFAELLAADPVLRRKALTTPVLLVLDGFDGPSAGLADAVARRLGRGVWWSSFPVTLSAQDATGPAMPTLTESLSRLAAPAAADWHEARPAGPVTEQEGPRPVPPLPATPDTAAPDTAAPDTAAPDPAARTAPAPQTSPAPSDEVAATRTPARARSSVGDPMEGVEPTSLPVPAAPVAAEPVRPLPPLPVRTLVAYGRDDTSPSAQGERTIERLAAQAAATGLRNWRAGAAPPRVEITGYGADARPATGPSAAPAMRRATTARARFTRLLTRELDRLQRDLPAGAPRLTAKDYPVAMRAMSRVPADWVASGGLQHVSRAELGRQATIGLSQTADAQAVQKLDTLRRHDRALRDRPFDVDALARRVLHLDPGATVPQDTRRELFALVGRATAAGRATGVAALAAFHLSELGVTAPDREHHFTVGGHRAAGLNWGEDDVVELDTTRSHLLPKPPGSMLAPTAPVPWGNAVPPYVVAAEGGPDRVEVLLPDGTTRDLDIDEFVELVAADVAREALPPGTPVVLAVPFAGNGYLDLPRKLADRTGLTVWARSGDVSVSSVSGAASTINVVRSPSRQYPLGDWVASDPGLAPDPDDDVPDWYRDVVSRPIVSARTGRQIGRASHHPAEFARAFEDHDRHLDRMSTFVHDYPATDRVSQEYDLPRPGPEDRAYRLDMHGTPGALVLALEDGSTRDVDEREAGPWLRRRKSLTTLPEDHWVDLVVCWSGSPADSAVPRPNTSSDAFHGPFVPDPLRTVSMAQHVANSTRRWVRLAHSTQSTRDSNGRYHRSLFADAQGRHRAWDLARPEPEEAELDLLAETAGLSPGDGEVSEEIRTGTLRLVRALRTTFGPYVDDAPDFGELLRGAAALDHMWRGEPDFEEAGPFTLDLLRRVVAARPEAVSGVDRQVTRRVLAAAGQQWAQDPDSRIQDFVRLPAVQITAGWLQEGGVEDEAAAVLRIDTDDVGEAEMSRMFWARVKAEETLSQPDADTDGFVERLLHLPPGSDVDDDRLDEALDVLTRAFAVGREASDPDVAAAYRLSEAGAYRNTMTTVAQGPADGAGRDYTGTPSPDTDLTRFRTPSGPVDAPWARNSRGQAEPVPFLVRVTPDEDDPDLLEVSWEGESYEVGPGEFTELLDADPMLSRLELSTPVVLAFPGQAADAAGLAARVAQRLGRSVWWTGFPADLSGTDDSGEPVLTLHATADGNVPGPAAWQRARPVHPASAQDAPRSLPAALPRGAGRAGRSEPNGPDRAFAPADDTASAPASPVVRPASPTPSASESTDTDSDTDSVADLADTASALLSDATRLTDAAGAARGRDWTGSAAGATAGTVDAGRIRLRRQRDGESHVTEQPAPWGDDAYVIAGEGAQDALFADDRELGPREIAELLAADPVLALLPPHVPVVLASPYAGAQDGRLAHAVARRLGRRVWAPSGDGHLEGAADGTTRAGTTSTGTTAAGTVPAGTAPTGAAPRVPTLVDADPDDAYGDWVPFDPPAEGTVFPSFPSADREWVTVDGVRFRDSDVDTRPLVGSDHRFEGRESMPDDGRRRLRERRLRRWREMRERTHEVRVGDTYHAVASEEVAPDPEASVYTFHAHGVPGGLKLAHRDGRVLLLGAEDGGRYVGGLPEVVARAAGDGLHVASCYGGVAGDPRRVQNLTRPAPPVEDPLEEVALAQHAANHSGRTTTAATGRTGYNDTRRLLAATPDGTLARMETFRPEPVDTTAQVAEAAGLGPLAHPSGLAAWDDRGPRALRLVRALRQVLGGDVETDRGVPGGRYERLLRGIGALETLRANDPALAPRTPLRRELWELLATPSDGSRPAPADYEAVLDRALAAPPGAALTRVWDTPALRAALDRFAADGDAVVRTVLRRPTGPVGPRERARALWAMTGAARLPAAGSAAEREELGRTALHLPATAPWDAAAGTRLRELAEQALAAGRDLGSPGDLAVFHLETLGAFADEGRVHLPDGTLQGRDWGAARIPGGLDPVRLLETGPTGETRRRFAPWTQEGAPAPWFVHAGTDAAGAVVLHLPGGTVHVPPDEFYALLEADPELTPTGPRRPLALLVPGLDTGPDTALGEFSLRNDRTVWSYDGPLLVTGGDATRPAVVTTLPRPATGTDPAAPEPAAWLRTRPQLPPAPARTAPAGPADSAEWNAGPAPAVPAAAPAGTPLPYSADGGFDERFAATLDGFPVAGSTDRHTVWGYGQDDPDLHVFVAEIPSLGLRGEYTSDGPSAGGVTDMAGRVHFDGPAWNWYLPGRGLVASSRLLTEPGTADPREPSPVPVGWPATGPVSPTPPVDPAAVAADPAALTGATLPDALWRDHDGPLYRFSPDGPERVFSEGLKPYGSETVHLIDHVYGGRSLVPDTVFASTTANRHYVRDSARANPLGAPALYRRYRWRYDLEVPGGIDVNATLGLASPFPDQEEVLFPGGVARRHIRGAQPMAGGVPAGPYVANPYFVPAGRVEDADFAGPAEPAAGPVLESFPALSLDTDGEPDSDDDPRPLLSRDDDSDDEPGPLPSRGREPLTGTGATPVPAAAGGTAGRDDSPEAFPGSDEKSDDGSYEESYEGSDEETDGETDALPAPPWALARVRYAQEALYFERRLAAYLGENAQVNEEFGKVVRAFWHIALHNRTDYRLFGSDSGEDGGAVGTSYEDLARVVESGNLRERVTFLFNGVATNLVPYLMGGVEPQHPVIGVERRDRHRSERLKHYEREVAELRAAELDPEDAAQEMAELEALLRTPLRPHEVWPALSPAERRLAVRDGVLLWSPAGQLHTLPMAADFQARSEDSGGLVLTGTSGSAYRIVTHVARLNRLAGVPVDLGLIRSGLVSILVGVGHHSFHEVMTGAQHALDEIGPTAAPVYADNWGRYWDVLPLTEEELRTFVAREGLFPDEHARALLAALEERERQERERGHAGSRRDGGDG
ncbi:lonely Cys domain-containing protein [Streptomyces beigongshangae]|uniref:lonely Cys domain-containing protein n=1 Tax=Streptomyces beigongshangae TaxID=2841597 RepID=UPI001C861253|nr:lonely Cys domain-containing protein [Streptomyces sp. REN17]